MKKTIFGIALMTMFALVSCGGDKTSTLSDDSVYSQSSSSTHEHTYSSYWSSDDEYHWHASTCGHDSISEKTKHVYKSDVTNPTFEAQGFTTYTCTICGHSYTASYTDKLKHSFGTTWENDSTSHWHVCLDEGYDYLKSDKSEHKYVDNIVKSTYEEKGYTTHTCSVCGYFYSDTYTDKLIHQYSDDWSYDAASHWHVCLDEGYEHLRKDVSAHVFEKTTIDPTYDSKGYTIHTCSVCGYSYKDSYTDKLAHKYSTNWLYDETYHWHGCEDDGFNDLKEDLAEHNFVETIVEPTYESKGYTLHSCECGYSYKDNVVDQLIRTYTITWVNWDGTVLETDVVEEGITPSYDGETPTHESDETYTYTFVGWSPEISAATSDQTYVATFTNGKNKYVISFDLNGGTSSLYEGSKTVEFFDRSIFFFDVAKENGNFRGWSYKGKKIFDETGKLFDTPEMEDEMTFVALFADTVKMNLTINMPEAGTISGNGEYQYNSNVDISAHPHQGYKFVGWYYEGFLLSTTENYNYLMWDKDVTIEARFDLDSFKMTIKSNDEEYGLVLLKTGYNNVYCSAYAEDLKYKNNVTISAFSKTEVRFLGWYDENKNLVSTNAVYSFTMPNHDYLLEARWNHFKIEYELNGGKNSEDNPVVFTTDDEITLFDAKDKPGYTFDGWYMNGEKVDKINKGTVGNITLEAKYSADLQGLSVISEDSSKGTAEIVSGEGHTDETITVKASPAEGYVFRGWYEGTELTSKEETYTFAMPARGISLIAKFYSDEEAETLGIMPAFDSASNTVTYGLYPQTRVSDETLISSLNDLTEAESNGWYLYEGAYYANKIANPYSTSYAFSDGTKITKGTKYWFKCEPIEWNILSSSDGTCSLVSSALLDAHGFNSSSSSRTIDGKTIYSNNYEYSDIRSWLNGDFYNIAFALNDTNIQTVTVDNSAATTDSSTNGYACSDTEDKVYLLSYQDYRNADCFPDNASRECKPTDWAKANYAQYYSGSSSEIYGFGYYWTRSPYFLQSSSYFAHFVSSEGYLSSDGVYKSYICVRPAITIKVA